MNTGMLWFDNDPKTELMSKIERAARYYYQKYGQLPDLCFVHPSMLADAPARSGSIEVKTNRSVLPNHFWLGIHQTSPSGD
ncbi:MAG: hypothetical protein ABFD44_01210 [Anaerolineaceae bacterium]